MTRFASQLADDLNLEWAELVRSGAFADDANQWLDHWPALRPFFDDNARTARLDRTVADEVLLALLLEHANGSYAAGRTVLQCMLGAAVAIARRCVDRLGPAEADAIVVAALWQAISHYPAHRPSSAASVASHLYFTTLETAVGRRRTRRPDPTSPLPPEVVAELTDDGFHVAEPHDPKAHRLGVTGEALEVIAWGVDTMAITPDEAALLTRLYVPETESPEAANGRAVAKELGITHAALRQRAHRAVRRLATAVHAGIDDGPWATR